MSRLRSTVRYTVNGKNKNKVSDRLFYFYGNGHSIGHAHGNGHAHSNGHAHA